MSFSSRRGFLRRTLGASWIGASLLEQSLFRANLARAQAARATPGNLFEIRKVADGVYAALAKPVALLNCNAAIFENANDLLIVDTHSKPSAVVALVAQIRKAITPKPVRYVVNSHFHWDHTQGAPAYRKLAPHADLVASEATRRLLAEKGAARLKASMEETRAALEHYRQGQSKAKTPAEQQYYAQAARDAQSYLEEMRNYAPELPNLTLERDLILHDKAHDLHLAFRGRGHTAGDVVVYCPQKQVVATGDLLHGFAPFLTDGYPLEWPRTLLSVAEFPFTQVIGGHGSVQTSRDPLYQKAAYIEELTEIVVKAKRDGKSPEQVQAATPPSALASLRRGGYGDFIVRNLQTYMLHDPGTTAQDILRDAVKTNIEQIYAALQNG
jgi:cyclase